MSLWPSDSSEDEPDDASISELLDGASAEDKANADEAGAGEGADDPDEVAVGADQAPDMQLVEVDAGDANDVHNAHFTSAEAVRAAELTADIDLSASATDRLDTGTSATSAPDVTSMWRKALGPAGCISGSAGLGLGATDIPALNAPIINHAGGTLLVLSAAAVLGRSLVHTYQLRRLARASSALRTLNIVEYAVVSTLWAGVAFLAVSDVNSRVLPKLAIAATVALWIVAGLQGLVIRAHRANTIEGEAANDEVRFGTEFVLEIKFVGGVTVAKLVAEAPRAVRPFFEISPKRVFGGLATVIMTIGLAFGGYHIQSLVNADNQRRANRDDRASSTDPTVAPTKSAASTSSTTDSASGHTPTTPLPGNNPDADTASPDTTTTTGSATTPANPEPSETDEPRPSYGDQCDGRGQEPGAGGPSWAANLLNDAWFGPGAGPAGCAQAVHIINNGSCPSAWEKGVDRAGQVVSIAVASKCNADSAIFLDNSAIVVEGLIENHYAVSGSCRRRVGDGDVQLVYGKFGTIALVRTDHNDDTHTIVLPPAGTAAMQQIIATTGGMVWPSTVSSTTFEFENASGGETVGTVHVDYAGSDPILATTGTLTSNAGKMAVRAGNQTLAQLTPGAPTTCH